MSPTTFPEKTTLVMAHPDDEALWASSVLSNMDRLVLCFEDVSSQPAWSEGRRRSFAAYPLPNLVHLGLRESEAFDGAAWPHPVETQYGLAIHRSAQSMPGFSEERYKENFGNLVALLRPILSNCPAVLTHSPWGEYGHEEHVQVFRAVAALQAEFRFSLWVPGYVSHKSFPLMLRHLPWLDRSLPPFRTNPELGARLQALYASNDCWTWHSGHVWPLYDHFYRWVGVENDVAPPTSGDCLSVNFLLWPAWPPKTKPTFLQRISRKLQRLVR